LVSLSCIRFAFRYPIQRLFSTISSQTSFHSGYSGGGGGSGGSISLSSCTLDAGSSSLVQANGGAGGRSRDTVNSNAGGGGGGGGIIKTETLNTIGTLVLQVDGGAPPSGGRKPGDAGSVGKVFLVSRLYHSCFKMSSR